MYSLRGVCRWDCGVLGHVLRKITQTTLRAKPHARTFCVTLRAEQMARACCIHFAVFASSLKVKHYFSVTLLSNSLTERAFSTFSTFSLTKKIYSHHTLENTHPIHFVHIQYSSSHNNNDNDIENDTMTSRKQLAFAMRCMSQADLTNHLWSSSSCLENNLLTVTSTSADPRSMSPLDTYKFKVEEEDTSNHHHPTKDLHLTIHRLSKKSVVVHLSNHNTSWLASRKELANLDRFPAYDTNCTMFAENGDIMSLDAPYVHHSPTSLNSRTHLTHRTPRTPRTDTMMFKTWIKRT